MVTSRGIECDGSYRRHCRLAARPVCCPRDDIGQALGGEWQIDSQLPIALDPASEPEPDVSVVPGDPDAYRDRHPSRPVLIVEVSQTSYRIDRDFKMSLYARASVPECWIVDVVRR